MIAKNLAEEVLSVALSSGGDFAEIFMEDKRTNSLVLTSGKLETAQSGREYGAGVRIFQGTQTVYAYTNDLSREGLIDTAGKAAAALGACKEGKDIVLAPSKAPDRHPARISPWDVEGKRKVQKLKDGHAAAVALGSEIVQVQSSLGEVDQHVLIANSEGLFITDRRVRSRFMVMAVASDGKENQIGFFGPGASVGFELFDAMVDPAFVGEKAAKSALTSLHAPLCPAGVMPVVIDKGFGGVIFHEACGHSLEATSVGKGNSVFCDKLGQPIASSIVSAVDEGLTPGAWGSINIDDEGEEAGHLVLIENGILKNYMIDRLGSRRMNMPSTGSARRQNYRFAATSRMRNTYICEGQDEEDEMIASMGDGLYAKEMGGGSVNPVTGEFNFSVQEGYLVKAGKIEHAVRGATLIGKGHEVLMRIDRVGKKIGLGQGVCGSQSGAVPTNVGQPMIRVSEMTVGGR